MGLGIHSVNKALHLTAVVELFQTLETRVFLGRSRCFFAFSSILAPTPDYPKGGLMRLAGASIVWRGLG